MINIMVDLETLGNGSNAVMLSVGAAVFNDEGIADTFYMAVNPQSCVDAGMQMDVSTVMWWMQQSDAARKAVVQGGSPLAFVLSSFNDWVLSRTDDVKNVRVWGNGATFDNVIMANAYKACNLPRPWPFWGDMCYRTLKNMAPSVKLERIGTAHNALDDAVSQAKHLLAIAQTMNLSFK